MADAQTINMGPGTYAVPLSLFRDNRERVCDASKAASKQQIDQNAFILLQGGDTINLYNTDVEYVFRQVNFNNFGILKPDIKIEWISENKKLS